MCNQISKELAELGPQRPCARVALVHTTKMCDYPACTANDLNMHIVRLNESKGNAENSVRTLRLLIQNCLRNNRAPTSTMQRVHGIPCVDGMYFCSRAVRAPAISRRIHNYQFRVRSHNWLWNIKRNATHFLDEIYVFANECVYPFGSFALCEYVGGVRQCVRVCSWRVFQRARTHTHVDVCM